MVAKEVKELLAEKKIHQIINPNLVQAPPSLSIREAIELMQERGSGYIVIAQNGDIKGLLRETDIIQKVLAQNIDKNKLVTEVMIANPSVASPEDSVGYAIDLMAKAKCYHLPLVDENKKLAGVISVRTIIRFLASFYPNEVYNLPPNVDQIMSSPEGG